MTTLRSRIHTESTSGFAVSILANLFVYRCHFGISFESFEYFVSSAGYSPGHCPPLAAGTSRPTASLSGVDSLKEAFTDFGREQVFEDFHVEKPEDVSWGAWQKRQSRQIAKVLAQVAVCRTGDDIVNLAATVLKTAEPGGFPVPLYL